MRTTCSCLRSSSKQSVSMQAKKLCTIITIHKEWSIEVDRSMGIHSLSKHEVYTPLEALYVIRTHEELESGGSTGQAKLTATPLQVRRMLNYTHKTGKIGP